MPTAAPTASDAMPRLPSIVPCCMVPPSVVVPFSAELARARSLGQPGSNPNPANREAGGLGRGLRLLCRLLLLLRPHLLRVGGFGVAGVGLCDDRAVEVGRGDLRPELEAT